MRLSPTAIKVAGAVTAVEGGIAVVVAVVLAGALALSAAVYLLNGVGHPYAGRLLSPMATVCLLVAVVVQAASLPMAVYLRAHKKEPLLAISVLSGLVTGILTVVLGRAYAAEGVAVSYLAVAMISTPCVALTWNHCRRNWHGG